MGFEVAVRGIELLALAAGPSVALYALGTWRDQVRSVAKAETAAEYHIALLRAVKAIRIIRNPKISSPESSEVRSKYTSSPGFPEASAVASHRMSQQLDNIFPLRSLAVRVTVRLGRRQAEMAQIVEEIWDRLELAVNDHRGLYLYEKSHELSDKDVAHRNREERVLKAGELESGLPDRIEARLTKLEAKAEAELAPVYNLNA